MPNLYLFRLESSFVWDMFALLVYNHNFSCLSGAFRRTGCLWITPRAFLDRSICVRISTSISIPHGIGASSSIVSLEFVSIDSTSLDFVPWHSVSPDSMSLAFVNFIGICETGRRVTRSCALGLRVRYDMI